MTVLSPFDEVICDLAQSQHLPRLKKLLVYACTHHWETNPERLAQFHLHYLIETLMQLAPTLDQLKSYLDEVTQTLSKPAEYLLIANTLNQSLQKLYIGPLSGPRMSNTPHLYWQVAQILEHDPEHLRIRKILMLLCRDHWEMDSDRLLAENLADLIYELHQLTQSFEHLSTVLINTAHTTSKPRQYEAIAYRIIGACRALYAESEPETIGMQETNGRVTVPATPLKPDSLSVAPSPQDRVASESISVQPPQPTLHPATAFIPGSTPAFADNPTPPPGLASSKESSKRTSLDSPNQADSSDTQLSTLLCAQSPAAQSTQASGAKQNRADQIHPARAEKTFISRSHAETSKATETIPSLTQLERFDLRLEVMKYAVPLLAKHLLFQALYMSSTRNRPSESAPSPPTSDASSQKAATEPWIVDPDVWLALKNQELDDLLGGLLRQSRTLSTLEQTLERAAHELKNPKRYLPVASAIARAVKTMMAKHQPSFGAIASQASGTDRGDQRDDNLTRQVVSSTVSFEDVDASPVTEYRQPTSKEADQAAHQPAHLSPSPSSSKPITNQPPQTNPSVKGAIAPHSPSQRPSSSPHSKDETALLP